MSYIPTAVFTIVFIIAIMLYVVSLILIYLTARSLFFLTTFIQFFLPAPICPISGNHKSDIFSRKFVLWEFFAFLGSTYKRDHTTFVFFCLTYFTYHNAIKVKVQEWTDILGVPTSVICPHLGLEAMCHENLWLLSEGFISLWEHTWSMHRAQWTHQSHCSQKLPSPMPDRELMDKEPSSLILGVEQLRNAMLTCYIVNPPLSVSLLHHHGPSVSWNPLSNQLLAFKSVSTLERFSLTREYSQNNKPRLLTE